MCVLIDCIWVVLWCFALYVCSYDWDGVGEVPVQGAGGAETGEGGP